jgi:hypothetical protein
MQPRAGSPRKNDSPHAESLPVDADVAKPNLQEVDLLSELKNSTPPAKISTPRWAFAYIYQTAGYVRAVLEPGC